MYQDSKSEGESNKPTIEIKEDAATEITLQISSNKELSKVTYHWNNEDEIEIDTKGKKKVEQKNRNTNRKKYVKYICSRCKWKRINMSKTIYNTRRH